MCLLERGNAHTARCQNGVSGGLRGPQGEASRAGPAV